MTQFRLGPLMIQRVCAVLAIIVLSACSSSFSDNADRTVRDSAGIRIADLPGEQAIQNQIEVSDTPLVRVGWTEAGHLFENIVTGGLWADGRAVIADGGALQLIVLSRTGAVDTVLGRPGDGPGEFRAIFAAIPLGEETVIVQDSEARRVTIFTQDKFVRTVPLDTVSVLRLLGVENGDLLMGPPRAWVQGRRYDTPWLNVPVVRFSLSDAQTKPLASVDWDQSIIEGRGDNPFMSGGFATAVPGGFVTARGDRAELLWYDADGRLRQITRWRAEPSPVTSTMISTWEKSMRAAFERYNLSQPDIEARISGMKQTIQEPLPYFGNPGPSPDYGGIISDSDGNVWIGNFVFRGLNSPRRYNVMSSDGEWVGWAEMPAGLRILAIGTDRALGVERDSLDVQAVSVYEIKKPRPR